MILCCCRQTEQKDDLSCSMSLLYDNHGCLSMAESNFSGFLCFNQTRRLLFVFFDRFEDLCKQKGVSKQRACIDCGLSRTAWNKWKAGAIPNGDAVQSLADYFGVTTDYLLTGEETKKAPTQEGERKVSDDDIKFALWGTREIDDDVLDRVRQFAKFAQENEKNK